MICTVNQLDIISNVIHGGVSFAVSRARLTYHNDSGLMGLSWVFVRNLGLSIYFSIYIRSLVQMSSTAIRCILNNTKSLSSSIYEHRRDFKLITKNIVPQNTCTWRWGDLYLSNISIYRKDIKVMLYDVIYSYRNQVINILNIFKILWWHVVCSATLDAVKLFILAQLSRVFQFYISPFHSCPYLFQRCICARKCVMILNEIDFRAYTTFVDRYML